MGLQYLFFGFLNVAVESLVEDIHGQPYLHDLNCLDERNRRMLMSETGLTL